MTLTVDLLTLKVHGVRVTYDVGYVCVNFTLPRPLCSRFTPDVRDRQTDVRQKYRLLSPPIRGEGITRLDLVHCGKNEVVFSFPRTDGPGGL